MIIFTCYFLISCTSLIFRPTKEHQPLEKEFTTNLQDFYFSAQDGTRLHGWYLSSTQDPLKPKKTILYLHGTTKNMSRHLAAVQWLPERGYEVYIFDYRGYGESGGSANLEGVITDIDAAFQYVAENSVTDNSVAAKFVRDSSIEGKEAGNKKFVVMGHSLGASLGIYALSQSDSKDQVESFIAVSAFSDYRTVTRDFLSGYWFAWLFQWPISLTINNDYRPLDYVSSLSPVQTIFLHGQKDEIIGPHHSLALYEVAQEPKFISVITSNHNDIFSYKENRELLIDYLERINKN